MSEDNVTSKGLSEIVTQRYSASLFLNFRPKTLSIDCFSVNFVKPG